MTHGYLTYVCGCCRLTWVDTCRYMKPPFNPFPHNDPFDSPGNKPFENTVGKGEIAHNEQFLLFPVFSTHLNNFLPFSSNLKFSSANSFSLEESKICRLVMG